MDKKEASKRKREWFFIVFVTILLICATYFEIRLSNLSHRLPFVNSIFFFGLINFNIILLMILVLLVFRNIGKVFLERRQKKLGSRLKTKLVVAFLSFTVFPTIILFFISSLYINSSFDKWFSIKIQNTLEATLDITQAFYKNTDLVAKELAVQYANEIQKHISIYPIRESDLKNIVKKKYIASSVDAVEVYVDPLDEQFLIAQKPNALDGEAIPRLPLDVLKRAFHGENLSLVQHIGGSDLIRAMAPIRIRESGAVHGIVAVTFKIPVSIVNRVDEIASVFQDYRDVNPLKYPVKSTYFIILVMITLLVVFVCIWIGLYIARQLTVPLERLVTATQKISEGQLDFEILTPGQDEIATLTSSFNTMMVDLKKNRVEIEKKTQELAEKTSYVETILNTVTAGVISVDLKGTITTINASAAKLLDLEVTSAVNQSLEKVLDPERYPFVEIFEKIRQLRGIQVHKSVQKYFSVEQAKQNHELLVTASFFGRGIVFVVDDISHLSKAQREAAWREVARRIAHEIKNPLTPIKLSAQRLQKKSISFPKADAAVLRECTDMIIQNVDALKDMVNEFSAFARFPSANPARQNLNEVIRETIVLYEEAHRSIQFNFYPEQRLPLVDFDRDQIKRALMNLLDNAVSAFAIEPQKKLSIRKVNLRTHFNEQLGIVMIEVEDNGPGMADDVKSRIFEPYFSTKINGTGLGLAIVKRIISDHLGYVRVQSTIGEGTKFTIELPLNLLERKKHAQDDFSY